MGITISHTVGIRKGRLAATLDRTEAIAKEMQAQAGTLGIKFQIRRESPTALLIDIGNCETLGFCFKTYEEYEAEESGWNYQTETLRQYFAEKVLNTKDSEHLKTWPEQRLMWSSDFCKTQFAGSLVEHRYVAELVRSVAGVADYAHVSDEGDYYHTLNIDDAAEAITENGALIASVGGMLAGTGWDVIKGGDTTIKNRKAKK